VIITSESPTNFIKKWWRKVCSKSRAANIHLKYTEKQLLGPMHPVVTEKPLPVLING